MDRIIRKILEKIEDEGFEAYLVGGYVRDYLLGKNSFDVDICTNALPKDLHKIFPGSTNSNNYGGFNLKVKHYNVDITTYRKELKYENRRPVEVVYINNLLDDLKRRDFTINAICMGTNEKIIDPLESITDIHDHIIRMIGDIDEKLQSDPLRILRAIRFATVLDFTIEDELYSKIVKYAKLVNSLSGIRIKEELNKILLSDNYQKGLDLLKNTKITVVINMKYNNIVKCSDINMMWAQIECDKIPFTKVEKDYIIKLKELMTIGDINKETMFRYGLYLNTIASEYFGISKKEVSKIYRSMPIKSFSDVNIDVDTILKVLEIKPSKVIRNVQNELISEILNNRLRNNKREIIKYLNQNKRKWQNE
jgi:tRNA nucleotidyltransferase/poly(A) polymerase